MAHLLESVGRPKTLGFQADMAHTLLYTLGYNAEDERILPKGYDWKDRKVLAGVLKTIYRAKDADAARAALEAFDASQWGQKYPAIAQSWRRNWERVIPFFAFPEAVRRIIY